MHNEPQSWFRDKNHIPDAPKDADHTYPVKTNRTKRVTGYVTSMIDRKLMPYHSSLERTFIQIVGLDPRCLELHAQPMPIDYSTPDGLRSYTADFYLRFQSGHQLLVETKPEADFLSERNVYKWPLIKERTRQLGLGFAWMNETELFRQPRFDNITMLQLYRSCAIDLNIANLIDRAFAQHPVIALQDLEHLSQDSLLLRDTVLALIVRRHLWSNFDQPLNAASLIQKVSAPFVDRTRN